MKLNQVTLPAVDMKKSCDFYLKLGCTQIVDTPHYARFLCPDGEATLSLSLAKETAPGVIIYFETDDVDAVVKKLEERGLVIKEPAEDKRYLWREALIEDPASNKIKIYHAGENRLNPPWRVTIRH